MKSFVWVKVLGLLLIGLSLSMMECKSDYNFSEIKSDILGNSTYPAICYSGYRKETRQIEPTIDQIKEDLLLMHAAGIRVLRTYQTKQFPHAKNTLVAIKQIQQERPDFEMYVMLGAWIQCEGAWTEKRNHEVGDEDFNRAEIEEAVDLVQQYSDLVLAVGVGNESMVHWAESYFVEPAVVLNWVNYLQNLKSKGQLPKGLKITSSDNFAAWGGGSSDYYKKDLISLIKAVDFLSVHTYPFHDTHYHPDYWYRPASDSGQEVSEHAEAAIQRAANYAQSQYQSVLSFLDSLNIKKPVHIGETGWSSSSNGFYGSNGSHAADEYKAGLYYKAMRKWTIEAGISCFFFEAFNEPWKDQTDKRASENHFGLFDVEGQAKYAIWDLVDAGAFKGLTRDGQTISKTYNGDLEALLEEVELPPLSPNANSLN